jgi:hypothetical protein
MYKSPYPSKNNQDATNLSSHDGGVVQGFIYGCIAINSHQDKNKDLQTSK